MDTKQTVKVSFAHIRKTEEGFALLTMKTTDGPEVEFLLDDLALSILGITYGAVIDTVKERLETDENDVRMHDHNCEDHK